VWRPGRGRGPLHAWRWWIVVAVILAGGLVEIGQSAFTEWRTADFWDWLSEYIAVLLAAGIVGALEGRVSGNTQGLASGGTGGATAGDTEGPTSGNI